MSKLLHSLTGRLKGKQDDVHERATRKPSLARPRLENPARGGTQTYIDHRISVESIPGKDISDSSDDEDDQPSIKDLEDFVNNSNDPEDVRRRYGMLPLMQSIPPARRTAEADQQWWHLDQIGDEHMGERTVFRGRVHIVRSMSAKMCFIVFREGITTVQGVLRATDGGVSETMVRFAEHMRPGTIVFTKATIRRAEQRVKTASVHDVELQIEELHVETARKTAVPFSVYEAEAATAEHKIADRVRLANRILDLRTPTSQAIFRVQSGIGHFFRDYLDSQQFIEIHTPKLQGGATEGGSEVFKLNYFGRPAFLAQSPQLAKQMCISADFQRVFEIGPVFRAENSNTPRHMTEFTGMDIEMVIDKHYHEAMHMIDNTLKHIFNGIYSRYRREIETVKHHFPHDDLVWKEETVRVTFAEGCRMLAESGWKNDDGKPQSEWEDLPTKTERELGRLVKEKFDTDYYILDKFPASARPFYTMPDAQDARLTNSFDFMVRGQEILSGAQRIHDYDMLKQKIVDAGVDPDGLKEYLDGFRYVAAPHAGAGIGLERLLSLILELGNLRYATLFHRDPRSFPLAPKSELRHPEDSTLDRPKGRFQSLSNLVANYGDASNTSWTDPRYHIWRDEVTGAAIGFAPMHGRAICLGDPLCDVKQMPDVLEAFIHWVRTVRGLKPIFMCVRTEVEEILGDRFGFRSLTNVAEQRVDLERNAHVAVDKDVERKVRHAKNAGLEVTNYDSDVPDDVRERCDRRIEEWKAGRKGEQVHISDIDCWTDAAHRTYFVTGDAAGKVHSLVVLAQLSVRAGTQVKWALDFPGAENGSIEMTVQTALKAAHDAGYKQATFGAGATPELKVGHHMGNAKGASLQKMYTAVAKNFHLDNKTGFRGKFNPWMEPLWIAYPAKGLGQKGIRAIVDFVKD